MDYLGTKIHFILERMLNDLNNLAFNHVNNSKLEDEIMEQAWSEIKEAVKKDTTRYEM
jgi:hypothetical protein